MQVDELIEMLEKHRGKEVMACINSMFMRDIEDVEVEEEESGLVYINIEG